MITRRAGPHDLGGIFNIATGIQGESVNSFPTPERDKLDTLLQASVAHPNMVYFGIAEHSERTVGGCLAYASDYGYARDIRVSLEVVFVPPERRGSWAAIGMIRDVVDWGRALNMRDMYFGHATGVAPERTAKLMKGLGFKQLGTLYRLDS